MVHTTSIVPDGSAHEVESTQDQTQVRTPTGKEREARDHATFLNDM